MILRWYTSQLALLPIEGKKRLTQQLMRSVRRGDLPSRKEWKFAVQRVAGTYFR